MAQQQSINEIKGTIGNLTYAKTKRGYRVRRKSSITKEMILTDARFADVRKNMSEFGSAGTSGKVLRNAVRPLLALAKDSDLISRLLKLMKAIVKTDVTNERGNRVVAKGSIDMLKGFNFNIDAILEASFFAPFTSTIDRVNGSVKLDIPSFQPSVMLQKPESATHYKILSSSLEIDFLKEVSIVDHQQSATLPCDNNMTAAISHLHNVTPNSTLPLLLVMGVQYFQSINGIMYPVLGRKHNPLAIVAVDKG